MIKSKKIIAVLATIAMLFFGAFALCLTNTEQNRAFANETTTSAVLMVDGAEVRISTTNSGLRFIGKVSRSYFTDTETPTLKDGVTVGMLLGKGEVTAEELTLENVSSKDLKHAVIDNWDISRSDDDYINFNVAMTSIPETDYGVSVIARAYVTENGATTYSENTCTRSIAEVADAALAENAITDKLNDTAKGICQDFVADGATALTVDNLTVLDGKVKWDENSNAKGYIVSYNDEIKQVKDANELLLTLADSDTAVKVVAYGDGVTYSCSTIAEKSVHALAENELANFNNESYNDDITCGPVASNAGTSDYTDMRTSGYESSVDGSNNGAMKIDKWICSYGSGSNFEGVQRNVVFGVKLQKGLDVTSNIVVRFKIYEQDFDEGETGLQLVGADNDTQNYTGCNYRQVATVGEWAELGLFSSDLTACGYKNGDTLIVFALRNPGGVSVKSAAKVYIDYIKYYNPPAAPTGLKIKDGTLSWDAVDGATGYVIECNGSTKEVTGTSYALSTITSDCTVSVYAKNAEGTSLASTINYHCLAENEIANFNNATYESDLTAGGAIVDWGISEKNNTTTKTNISYIGFGSGTPKYSSDITDSNSGAVLVKSKITNYGNFMARHSVFTVDLQKTIDTESYSGIKVRIQLKECDLTNAGNIYFKLLGDEESEGYLTRFEGATESADTTSPQTEALTKGEWVELTITNEQLKAYYASGTDKLYFAFVTVDGCNASMGYSVSGYLDYIKYYSTTD